MTYLYCAKVGRVKNLFAWDINDWKIFTCSSNLCPKKKWSWWRTCVFFSLFLPIQFSYRTTIHFRINFIECFYDWGHFPHALYVLYVGRWLGCTLVYASLFPISFAFFFFFFALPSLWSGWYHCELITRRHYQYCFSFVKKLSQYWKICLHKLPNICTFFLSPFNFFFLFFFFCYTCSPKVEHWRKTLPTFNVAEKWRKWGKKWFVEGKLLL